MKLLASTFSVLIGLSAFIAQSEQLLEVACAQGSTIRTVQITYWNEGGRPLCRVMYRKPSERPGFMHVIWTGRDVSDTCERKAAVFLDKLRGWGWNCDGSPASSARP